MKRTEYGAFIREFAGMIRESNWDKRLQQREDFLKSGNLWNLSWIGHLSSMEAALYYMEGQQADLDKVKGIAAFLCETKRMLDAQSTEERKAEIILENIFSFVPFMKALRLVGKDKFSEEEWKELEELCFSEIQPIFTECEWGRHNRCALRAVALVLFAQLFEDHPQAPFSKQLSEWLIEDSLGNWSIEDAASYIGIWLTCITEYTQYTGRWNARIEEILSYYAHYFAAMLLPSGGIPEFGDTRFDSATSTMLVLGTMELIAARHRDGVLKYAIERQFRNVTCNRTMDNQAQMERGMCNAWLWADDSVEPEVPEENSMEVLDEIIGKKVVFRSGWDEKASYLFYNYKDVGCGGRQTIDYLQRTIPVHAEKPHHGHADEQAINALCSNGAVFLRDGGYRDCFTTNGHYRADFYHNRLVVRNGRIFREKGFLEYAENIGDYVEVATQKLYFKKFAFAQTVRTRMQDAQKGVVCDRQIIYLPKENVYVVADTLQSQTAQPLTAGVMYHAETIQEVEPGYYRVMEDSFEGLTHFHDFPRKEIPHEKQSMAVGFASIGMNEKYSREWQRRNYRQETALSQYISRYFAQGEYCSFVSLLIPETGETPEEIQKQQQRSRKIWESLAVTQTVMGKNLTITLSADGTDYVIGIECDRERRVADYNRRPAYTCEAGRCRYGDYETDASFFISDGERFGMLDGIKVAKGGHVLFQAPKYTLLQLDFEHNLVTESTWGCYEGEVK